MTLDKFGRGRHFHFNSYYLDMKRKRITNLHEPVELDDAVNKSYLIDNYVDKTTLIQGYITDNYLKKRLEERNKTLMTEVKRFIDDYVKAVLNKHDKDEVESINNTIENIRTVILNKIYLSAYDDDSIVSIGYLKQLFSKW